MIVIMKNDCTPACILCQNKMMRNKESSLPGLTESPNAKNTARKLKFPMCSRKFVGNLVLPIDDRAKCNELHYILYYQISYIGDFTFRN